MRIAAVLAAAVAVAAAGPVPSRAAQARTVETSAAELQRGEADGVAITSRGRLLVAPRLAPLGESVSPGRAAHVWAIAADASGNVFLGTGPDGRVVKITPAGRQSVFFAAKEPLVTALLVLPGGDLLAATAPEGRVYRIRPDGTASPWSEIDARYIWSLTITRDGTVLAGTGEQGIVFRLDKLGKPTPLFDSEEAHIVALEALADGDVLAGGSGRGRVYRINGEGRALVLHDDDLPEAHALAVEADGSVLAAFVNFPEPERRPPAVRIQVTGGSQVGDAVGADDRSGVPKMQGIIEGLPDYAEESGKRIRGRVVRIGRDGAVTEIWRSATEAPFSIALDETGRPLFGTGEPARIYRIESDGEIALIASLREGQVTGALRAGVGMTFATSNPAATYSFGKAGSEPGVFLSRPLDAGGTADWGTLRWLVEGDAGRVEVYTRTGNAADPDETWSAWSPALRDPSGSPIPNPPGRFLQWRARILSDAATRIGPAAATYVTENRPPQVRDLRLEPAARAVSGKLGLKWSAFDPDGDPAAVDVQYRSGTGSPWVSGVRSDPPALKPGEPVAEGEPSWREGKVSWDTSSVPEGTYQIRVVASDQASNPEGAGGETVLAWASPIIIDRTPPELAARRVAGGGVEITVSDAASPVVRLEVMEGGRILFAPRPSDGVADSGRESFRLSASEAGAAGERTLRAVDAAGNVVEAPVPSP